MKKLIAVTITLCLMFAAIVPCFAASDVVVTAFYNGSTGSGINAGQLMQSLLNSVVAINSKLPAVTSTGTVFENIDTRLGHIESWLVPENSAGTNPSLYQLILELGIAAQSYLPYIPTISNYVGNWMATNNDRTLNLVKALSNTKRPISSSTEWTVTEQVEYAHRNLLFGRFQSLIDGKVTGYYTIPSALNNGGVEKPSILWNYGTPLGNIAVLLDFLNDNIVNTYRYRWAADLTHYNDTLTTWDSQGDTLTQVTFTPDSAIQGLYRYLAFVQRDVARLSYVFSNDAELQAREYAQETQETVAETFINPTSDASMTQVDAVSIAGQSQRARQNFTTGYSASGVWGAFSNDVYSGTDGWFTQTTANNLDTSASIASTRKTKSIQPVIEEDYPTPLLDAYYEEIYSLQGDLDD